MGVILIVESGHFELKTTIDIDSIVGLRNTSKYATLTRSSLKSRGNNSHCQGYIFYAEMFSISNTPLRGK